MELLRTLVAVSMVLGVIVFLVIKFYYYLLVPLFAPLALAALYLYCAYWILFESTSLVQLLVAYALAQSLSRPLHAILNRIEIAWLQRRRDNRANQVLEANLKAPFALYLRPFVVTDRLGFYGISSKWGGADLEAIIAQSCRSWGELLALGRPGEAVGAGRIAIPENAWKEKFYTLSERAKAIILIPSARQGTFFEMEWLKNNRHLAKTMFLMPPKTRLRGSEMLQLAFTTNYSRAEKDYSKDWESMRTRAEAIGLRFPPYSQAGALIQFRSGGDDFVQYDLGEDVPMIRRVLNEHLRHLVMREEYCS